MSPAAAYGVLDGLKLNYPEPPDLSEVTID